MAELFDRDIKTIGKHIANARHEEMFDNGYQVLRGKKLKAFLESVKNFGKDIYVPTKTTVLDVFAFRVFLNMAMLLSESEKVRDTFYSEILDVIAAYESGLADAIKREYEQKGHILSQQEVEELK